MSFGTLVPDQSMQANQKLLIWPHASILSFLRSMVSICTHKIWLVLSYQQISASPVSWFHVVSTTCEFARLC
jgi:hypothetical protein